MPWHRLYPVQAIAYLLFLVTIGGTYFQSLAGLRFWFKRQGSKG